MSLWFESMPQKEVFCVYVYGKDTLLLLQDKAVEHFNGQRTYELCLFIFCHFLTPGFLPSIKLFYSAIPTC